MTSYRRFLHDKLDIGSQSKKSASDFWGAASWKDRPDEQCQSERPRGIIQFAGHFG